jgi:3',5'-cyclic AMP phosphodiesterase CpdA
MRDVLTWLHVSDIHFHPRTDWRDSIVRTGLLKYLKAEFAADPSLCPDLIFCTGDIAYGETGSSPLADQYVQASAFFDELLSTCGREGTPLSRDRLYVVPGNHDVNQAVVNSDAQNTLVNWAKDPATYVEKINQRFNDRSKEFEDAVRRFEGTR